MVMSQSLGTLEAFSDSEKRIQVAITGLLAPNINRVVHGAPKIGDGLALGMRQALSPNGELLLARS